MIITALKRIVIIKGVSIHISISPSLYPSDVERHNSYLDSFLPRENLQAFHSWWSFDPLGQSYALLCQMPMVIMVFAELSLISLFGSPFNLVGHLKAGSLLISKKTSATLVFNGVNLWPSHLRGSCLGNDGPIFLFDFLELFSSFFAELADAALWLLLLAQSTSF
jgi:hypothetical protein